MTGQPRRGCRRFLNLATRITVSDKAVREVTAGDALPPGFVRAVLDETKFTDLAIDALEARVVALEQVAAARGIRHISAARRLGRSLRASVRNFAGHSFAERRYEAASTEFGSP